MGEVRNRRRARGRVYLKEKEFFQRVSEYCNYLDIETIQRVYRGLVKATMQELRRTGMVRFPDFGDFILLMYPERKIFDVRTGGMIALSPRRSVKYHVDYKVRKYLTEIDVWDGKEE